MIRALTISALLLSSTAMAEESGQAITVKISATVVNSADLLIKEGLAEVSGEHPVQIVVMADGYIVVEY